VKRRGLPVNSWGGQISEYDGSIHRENLTGDNRRQNRMVNAGYRLLRFTAADVLSAPRFGRGSGETRPLRNHDYLMSEWVQRDDVVATLWLDAVPLHFAWEED
jgi:hypothetical protein